MKPFNLNDVDALKEIASLQDLMHIKIQRAKEKEENNQTLDALELYIEAQHLSFYVGEGLKVRIINETIDCEMWHSLNNKINHLDNEISHHGWHNTPHRG